MALDYSGGANGAIISSPPSTCIELIFILLKWTKLKKKRGVGIHILNICCIRHRYISLITMIIFYKHAAFSRGKRGSLIS